MKPLSFIVFFAVPVLCTNVWAGPAFGLKGGVNLANATVHPSERLSYNIKPGFLVGPAAEISLSKSNETAMRWEILYAQKGCKISGGRFFGHDEEVLVSANELALALFLVLRFPPRAMTPFLQMGPELGISLSAEWTEEIPDLDFSKTEKIEDWRSTNSSVNLGAGVAIRSGKGEVVIDARYNLGLSNMNTSDEDINFKTNGIQFLLGYNFTVPSR